MSSDFFILDASGFIFRAYFALPEMKSPTGEAVQAVYGFIRSFQKLVKEFSPDFLISVFDGPNNKESRKLIYSEYKSNRIKKYPDIPLQIEKVKEFCTLSGIPFYEENGVEADDVIATLAIKAQKEGYKVYLCTSDKDLAQMVGQNVFLLNPWKNNEILNEDGVIKNFGIPPKLIPDYLALVGDSSDNIPGVKGLGPRSAVSLLQEFGSVENMLSSKDKIKGEKKKALIEDQEKMLLTGKELALLNKSLNIDLAKQSFRDASLFIDQDLLNSFYRKNGFKSLLSIETQEQNDIHFNKVLISSLSELEDMIKMLTTALFIGLSTTLKSKGPFYLNEIESLAFCVERQNVFCLEKNLLNDEQCRRKINDFFLSNESLLVGFDVKYDRHVMENIGLKNYRPDVDLAIASYLLDSEKKISLEDLYINYFPDAPSFPLNDSCSKAKVIYMLQQPIMEDLKKRGLDKLFFDLEMPLLEILFYMEKNGVFLNKNYLHVLGKDLEDKVGLLAQEIYVLAGEEFNINSPKQLSYILYDKLNLPSIKKRSTSASVLVELSEYHPIIDKLIEYRSFEKLRTGFVNVLIKQLNPKTNRIHPTFSQITTATGRLSCINPNLQTIPNRSDWGLKIRASFKPQKEDRLFLSVDYSQIELRFLAHFSDDPVLKEAFFSNEDIHSYTASKIFNIPIGQVTKQHRYKAKAVNFGLIYGQQAFGLSKLLKIPLEEAKSIMEAYFQRYPLVTSFIKDCIESAKKLKKTVTFLGRERLISGFSSKNKYERELAERLAVNTPLQGSAADLIKKAMIDINNFLDSNGLRSFVILQIHDELIFEVFQDEKELLIDSVPGIMEKALVLKVPLVVNISLGKNLAEC